MPATIAQNTGRYWWALIIAFLLGAGGTLWAVQPRLCDVPVKPTGSTVCHGRAVPGGR